MHRFPSRSTSRVGVASEASPASRRPTLRVLVWILLEVFDVFFPPTRSSFALCSIHTPFYSFSSLIFFIQIGSATSPRWPPNRSALASSQRLTSPLLELRKQPTSCSGQCCSAVRPIRTNRIRHRSIGRSTRRPASQRPFDRRTSRKYFHLYITDPNR